MGKIGNITNWRKEKLKNKKGYWVKGKQEKINWEIEVIK